MNRLLFAFLLLAVFHGASAVSADPLPSTLRVKSLGFPARSSIQAADCLITEVQVSGQNILVQFTGRWSPRSGFADTERNGFSISREPSVSQSTWAHLARRFSDQQGKPVTLTITTGSGFMTRGGIPLVNFPSDRFDITSLARK